MAELASTAGPKSEYVGGGLEASITVERSVKRAEWLGLDDNANVRPTLRSEVSPPPTEHERTDPKAETSPIIDLFIG